MVDLKLISTGPYEMAEATAAAGHDKSCHKERESKAGSTTRELTAQPFIAETDELVKGSHALCGDGSVAPLSMGEVMNSAYATTRMWAFDAGWMPRG